jgi:hypothetical protein
MIFFDSLSTVASHKGSKELAEMIRKMAQNFELTKVPFGQTGNNILYLRRKSSKTT